MPLMQRIEGPLPSVPIPMTALTAPILWLVELIVR
jgi:hypothetical protein